MILKSIQEKLRNLSRAPIAWLDDLLTYLKGLYFDSGASRTIVDYWEVFGGFKELKRSPYLVISLFFSCILWFAWAKKDDNGSFTWAQTAIDVLPSMLGFSMGGMAIVLSLSSGASIAVLVERGDEKSYFVKMVANFMHFILVQTIAILLSIVNKFTSYYFLSFFGFWIFMYAIFVGLATAALLFNTSLIVNSKIGRDEAAKHRADARAADAETLDNRPAIDH